MKYICLIISMFLLSCSSDQNNFEGILQSLEKNYTTQNIPNKEILFCWNLSRSNFVKDSLEYKKGLGVFYKQKKSFVKYLLTSKNDNEKYNNWIVTKNPCLSDFEKSDFISNSKGVLILIDNLFCNQNGKIIVNDYINQVKFESVKKIILEDENVSFDQIKKRYIEYIHNIK